MRMNNDAGIGVTLLAVMSALLAGCAGEAKEKAPAEPYAAGGRTRVLTLSAVSIKEMGLTLAVAAVKPIAGTMSIPAKLIPNQDLEAHVGSLVPGRVRVVSVRAGDPVRAGQELMRIEGLEVGEIVSKFIKARAQLKYIEENRQRQKSLLDQQVGSQKAYLEVQAEYAKALADFQAEDKRIHSIGLTDDDLPAVVEPAGPAGNIHGAGILPIKAPIAGIVVERNVVIGQLVDETTVAFRIVNTSELWADGQVYEKEVSSLSGKPEVTLTVTAFPGEEFHGRVIYLSPVVNEQSRTITIRASIPNRPGRLKPQMFGELHIPVGGTTKGLLVPAESVLSDNGERYVFVATSDTTFERRAVSTGVSFGSMTEVKQGISPGERVVTVGSFQLKSEMMKDALAGGE